MELKDRLVGCGNVKEFADFCKQLTPALGKLGGRRFYIHDAPGTVCLNDLVKRLDTLQPKHLQPTLDLESLDQRAEDLLKTEKNYPLMWVTTIKRFFSNLIYKRAAVLEKLKAEVAERKVDSLRQKIETAFKRAQEAYKESSFGTYFGEQKIRDHLEKLVVMPDKKGLEAALLYRKNKRALTKLLRKVERLEVGSDAEERRNKALEKRALRIQKVLNEKSPVKHQNLPALYTAFEECREQELNKLIQSGADWAPLKLAINGNSYDITLYPDGKSYIHLPTKLGAGGVKTVYLAISYESNSLAVQMVPVNSFHDTVLEQYGRLNNELEIVASMQHSSNIVIIKKKRIADGQIGWFSPYYNCGDFIDFQESPIFEKFDNAALKSLYQDIARGISQVHANEIIHRDVKCENILIETLPSLSDRGFHFRAALTDFDLARKISDNSNKRVGSPCYCAPEILLPFGWSEDYSRDWYSFGMSIAMACGLDLPELSLYQRDFHNFHISHTLQINDNPAQNTPPFLLKNLMCFDPTQRNAYQKTVEEINNVDWTNTSWEWDAKFVPIEQ